MSRKDEIIERLKENGCRITKQRKILIDIILENDCASCKEIFYKASQEDKKDRGGDGLPHDQCAGRDRGDQPQEYVPDRIRRKLRRRM